MAERTPLLSGALAIAQLRRSDLASHEFSALQDQGHSVGTAGKLWLAYTYAAHTLRMQRGHTAHTLCAYRFSWRAEANSSAPICPANANANTRLRHASRSWFRCRGRCSLRCWLRGYFGSPPRSHHCELADAVTAAICEAILDCPFCKKCTDEK